MIRSWHRCRCRRCCTHAQHRRHSIELPSHHSRKEMGRMGHWKFSRFYRQTTGGTKPSPPCSFGSMSLSSMGWQIRCCWSDWIRSGWRASLQSRVESDDISHRWKMGQTTCFEPHALSSTTTKSGASSSLMSPRPTLVGGCSCCFSRLLCYFWRQATFVLQGNPTYALVSCISKVLDRWYSFTWPLRSSMLLFFFFTVGLQRGRRRAPCFLKTLEKLNLYHLPAKAHIYQLQRTSNMI